MSKILLLILFISFSSVTLKAQEIDETTLFDQNTPIIVTDGKYYQNETRIAYYNIVQILESNIEASKIMKSAKRKKTWAQIGIGTGVFLIGGQIGRNFTNQRFIWEFAGIGAGLIGGSIPLFIKSKKQSTEAIDIFNAGLQKTSVIKPKLKYLATSNGMGVYLQF